MCALGVGAFELGNVAATLLILRATQLLAPALGHKGATQLALTLYIGYNVAATVASLPAGRLGDRWGAVAILTAGVALFGLAYLGLAAGSASLVLLGACFVTAAVAIGCVETAEHAAVAALAPVELRGSAFGVLATVQGVGNLAASAVGGTLWTLLSGQAAFLYLAAWMLVSLVTLGRLRAGQAPAGPAS
jgi:MFS family permease